MSIGHNTIYSILNNIESQLTHSLSYNSGNNRALICLISGFNDIDVSSVKYNSIDMNAYGGIRSVDKVIQFYYLLDNELPDYGNYNFNINFSSTPNSNFVFIATEFNNAKQEDFKITLSYLLDFDLDTEFINYSLYETNNDLLKINYNVSYNAENIIVYVPPNKEV